MSLGRLSWGKGKADVGTSTGDMATTLNVTMPAIVEKSATLVTNQGAILEAREQGGGMIDRREADPSFVFSFEVYHQTGAAVPIPTTNNKIPENKSIRFTPENPAAWGFEMPYCHVSVENRWDEDKGSTLFYTFTALKPNTGEMFRWIANGISANPNALTFVAGGETKTSTLAGTTAPTASASQSWITASISGTTLTIVVASNSGAARTGTVTVTDGSQNTVINVSQAAA